MNFLSHFYHESPCDDPYFTAGLILPDILSNYSFRNQRVVKLHSDKLQNSGDRNINALSDGVRRHYFVDGKFHSSPFFESNVAMIKDTLAKGNFKSFNRRMYAFAHVLLELILDRRILNNEVSVCDDFYSLLHAVDDELLIRFISVNTTAEKPRGIASHFEHFRKVRFIYEYRDDDRLTSILNSINQRLGNPPFESAEKERLKAIIHDIENAVNAQKFPKFRTDY